jgi:hypothetical protein
MEMNSKFLTLAPEGGKWSHLHLCFFLPLIMLDAKLGGQRALLDMVMQRKFMSPLHFEPWPYSSQQVALLTQLP